MALSSICRCKTERGPGHPTEGEHGLGRIGLLAVINKKRKSLPTLKKTIDGIERSVHAMSDNYDQILKRIKQQERYAKDIRKKVEAVEGNGNGPII